VCGGATFVSFSAATHAAVGTNWANVAIDRHSPTIFVTSQTISQGGGQGKFPLDEVTEEFVQATVLKFFQRLTSEG
jgi:hypothetical protein